MKLLPQQSSHFEANNHKLGLKSQLEMAAAVKDEKEEKNLLGLKPMPRFPTVASK